MRGSALSPAQAVVGYWLSSRRLELASVIVTSALAALLWREDLPTQLLQPQLAPEQMLQLFAPLVATALVVALRRDQGDHHLRLASVGLRLPRAAVLAAGLLVGGTAAYLGSTAMPDDPAVVFLRNVAAYTGAALVIDAASVGAAITVIWLWLAVSVSTGRSLDEGHVAFQWWAYPLHDPTFHPEVAVLLVALGSAARILR